MQDGLDKLTPEVFRDGLPWDELDRLRDEEPVSQMRLPDGTLAWNLVRYEDVAQALRALQHYATPSVDVHATFASAAEASEQTDAWSIHAMMVLRPPTHGEYRRRFTGLMKRDLLEQLRPRISHIAGEAVRTIQGGGGCRRRRGLRRTGGGGLCL